MCWVTKSAANLGNQRTSEAVCWHICHQCWTLNLTALYLYTSDKQEGNGQVGMGEEINFVSNTITLQEIPWDCFALWSSDYICVPFKYLQREVLLRNSTQSISISPAFMAFKDKTI